MFSDAAALLGRLLLSAIFIMSGIHKLTAWDQTLQAMQQHGITAAEYLLPVAVVFELGGGLLVLFGLFTRLGALLLIVFLIPTTLLFHNFWAYQGEAMQTQMINFMKNLAIFGGLFTVLGFGPGRFSIDALLPRTRPITVTPPRRAAA